MNNMNTDALRELIAAELAAEQPGRDAVAARARLDQARARYEQALDSHAAKWDHALISDRAVDGTPVVERPRRRRARPLSPQARRLRANTYWQQALGR